MGRAALPRRVANDAAGIAQLVAALVTLGPRLVVLEATGTYHRPLLAALLAAEIPTVVANPADVAAFRTRRRGREQTDAADARRLARYAAVEGAEVRRAVPADPVQARLRELVAYRDDLIGEQTRTTNRLHAQGFGGDPAVATWLATDLEQRAARLREVAAARGRGRARPAARGAARGGAARGDARRRQHDRDGCARLPTGRGLG